MNTSVPIIDFPLAEGGAYQGELLFERVEDLPEKVTPNARSDEGYIVGHSETGHHHVVQDNDVDHFLASGKDAGLVSFLRVTGDHADVVHLRPYDTHHTLRLPKGTYRVRTQVEYRPEGWEKVVD